MECMCFGRLWCDTLPPRAERKDHSEDSRERQQLPENGLSSSRGSGSGPDSLFCYSSNSGIISR